MTVGLQTVDIFLELVSPGTSVKCLLSSSSQQKLLILWVDEGAVLYCRSKFFLVIAEIVIPQSELTEQQTHFRHALRRQSP
jgi:hypothetical protein